MHSICFTALGTVLISFFVAASGKGLGLNNGLALTPPMGWLSWARFFCETDCEHHPLGCINERLYMDMADRLAEDGYKEAGYSLVNIDDCWPAMQRDAQNRLQADPIRFPHGIKWLANYVHSKGLKLGIYEDYGTKTCGGYPGSLDYLQLDAQTFASWDIDMLKLDGCYSNWTDMDKGYPMMTKFLNETGRPIIFSCSWPAYVPTEDQKNYSLIADNCNLWRNFDDIMISWESIRTIIDYYDLHQDKMVPAAGPGHWNDPDMIVVGNPELTVDQAQAQMAIWSIYAAPLLMSNDLRFVTKAQKEILLNRRVIAIDQDPLGLMGRLVANTTYIGTYVRRVTPVKANKSYSFAIAILNRHLTERAQVIVEFQKLGLTDEDGYEIQDLFTGRDYGIQVPATTLTVIVNPTGVVMLKATVVGA